MAAEILVVKERFSSKIFFFIFVHPYSR